MSLMVSSVTRSLATLLGSVPLLWASACNNTDPIPVYFDLNYQVGCVRPECTNVFHEPERIVMSVDGVDGYQNTCEAQNVEGATLVNLSAKLGSQQTFQISGALIGVPGNVGSSCRVLIVEGNNTFEGACSTAAPTPAVPCQLTNFGPNASGLLTGSLYCDNIAVANAPAIKRDVAKAGTFGTCRDSNGQPAPQQTCPAEFLIEPCNGL